MVPYDAEKLGEMKMEAKEFKIFGGTDIEDNLEYYWIFRPCDIKEWSGEQVRGWRKIKEIHDVDGVWTARIAKIYLPIDATEEEIIRAF